jgi:hypothetical protein
MKISKKREVGEKLGRGGISQRIITIASEISEGTYKEAIEKAGQISVLVESASFDDYWHEKAKSGQYLEMNLFGEILEGNIELDEFIVKSNPYK